MNRKTISAAGCRIIITAALTVIVLVCISSFSCQLSPEGITMLGGTYDCPKLIDFSIEGKNELKLTFSQEVAFSEMRIASTATTREEFEANTTSPDNTAVTETEGGSYEYALTFSENFDCGTNYVLYAVVEDAHGNSLSFSSGFSGYNDHLPRIVLNEVRTEYSKPKLEYVELYVLEDGNIGGMVLEAYYGAKLNAYTFPAVEVHRGDYIVLHMRTVEESAFDETDNITESGAADSCDSARDFWFPSEVKALGKTGVILLKERENGALTDALLYAESGKTFWPQDSMKAAAQSAFLSGLWADGAEPGHAVCSDKCTTTRTLSRQDYETQGASAWIVTATSCATPGAVNSSRAAE